MAIDPAEERKATPEQVHAGAQAEETRGLRRNRFGMEQTRFGIEEQQRRKKSLIYISGDLVANEHQRVDSVYIVDPRLGFTNKTHRFWINHLPAGGEEGQQWKKLGHRHTVEAVICWLGGHGHSIIDGKRYDWEAGDFVCVPMFSWHRHVNESDRRLPYAASTTGPLSMGIGQAVYEDENYPEFWVYAQQGEQAQQTLIPGGAQGAEGLAQAAGCAARLYAEQVAFAAEEEARRRESRVLVRANELKFEPTAMGNLAYVVDPRIGFHVKALSTVVADVPPGKHSGAHRHFYDEIDYVLAGSGKAIIDDLTFDIKKGDTLSIPVFAWHQYFNTGSEPLRILAHSTRPALENLGLSLTQQGELADY
ncbi:MAG TPA: cupin domain-containing protein [Chloroflexota bacterium]|nr:cupin domain-containing protein [Chloroflexota bacterium]